MTDKAFSDRRKRGVVLSFQGWQRLQSAEQLLALQQNDGKPYTLEQLSQITGLSPNTLTKVRRRRKAVDWTTLEVYFQAFDLTLTLEDCTSPDSQTSASQSVLSPSNPLKGPLRLGSLFYIYRPPVEQLCFQEILNPGTLVRIKAPRQFGKTSLITQILGQGHDQNLAIAVVNLQLIGHQLLEQADSFLKWLCAVVARELNLPNELETRWDSLFGSNYSCTDYFETYLLPNCDRGLLLVIDGLDELFPYSELATDFFGLLRAWYEQGRYGANHTIWQRLRLVIAHAMEVWLPLSLHQSPFNVGLSIELPGFTPSQTHELASRYGLTLTESEAEQLHQLIDGHPYLTQLSLFHLSRQMDLEQLLATAIAYDGIYSSHLRRQFSLLETDPDLLEAMTQVVTATEGAKLSPHTAFRLQGLGLVRFDAQRSVPSCGLYHRYFATILEV